MRGTDDPVMRDAMTTKKVQTTQWLKQPTGTGLWWYCGDDSNLGRIANYRCRGKLEVYLRDDDDGKKHLTVDGFKCSMYKGIWRKVR